MAPTRTLYPSRVQRTVIQLSHRTETWSILQDLNPIRPIMHGSFSVGVDGGDVRQLTHDGFVQISRPSISSGGKGLLDATLSLYTPQRMEVFLLDHSEKPSVNYYSPSRSPVPEAGEPGAGAGAGVGYGVAASTGGVAFGRVQKWLDRGRDERLLATRMKLPNPV